VVNDSADVTSSGRSFQVRGLVTGIALRLSKFEIAVGYCFFVQNFAQIGPTVVELQPKMHFLIWRPSAISGFRILRFGDKFYCSPLPVCCSVQNFIKIEQFFTKIWRFQDGDRPPF